MIDKLLSPEVQKFIKDHQKDDPFLLSLNTKQELDFPLKEAIEQIQSLQKAKSKLPTWISKENIIWPSPISIEQSSSEITAQYKSSLIHGKSLNDLTAGMGVDVSFFANSFEHVTYVEPNLELCELSKHNLKVLEKGNVEVLNTSAEHFLAENTQSFDFIYVDPSRRSEDKKVFRLEDCSPNLVKIVPDCLKIAPKIMVKLSPLVDISLLLKTLSPNFIWVVGVKNEVKEVLCLIERKLNTCRITAVMLNKELQPEEFKFFRKQEKEVISEFSLPLEYIYEPNASIMKAGAFKLIARHYELYKLHLHTHLYTSEELIEDFPGKIFRIHGQIKADKKEILRYFPEKKASVITRNYPQTANQVKSKFGLRDGGDQYLLATTLINEKKAFLVGDRLN